ncbi:MAG: DUF4912 domain-containing protein [Candidatus Saganbacteria bacterium]|nr:DUF4912 domain-containing protein [Candidatus Saganbacteria bacterium]
MAEKKVQKRTVKVEAAKAKPKPSLPAKAGLTAGRKKVVQKTAIVEAKKTRKTVGTAGTKKVRKTVFSLFARSKKGAAALQTSGQSIESPKPEISKYVVPPYVEQKFAMPEQYHLPGGYGDTKIVLMVRDPYWLYTYWEINSSEADRIKAEIGEEVFIGSKLILRVYDITGVSFTGINSHGFFDIEISSYIGNWYIQVGRPNRAFIVDIGYRTSDGRFILLARSNAVMTPRDQYSEEIDEEWMIPDWDKMYSLSGGFGIGRSSGEIKAMMKKRLEERMGSGWVSSISSPSRPTPERPFWLVADAELIVYGATEPTAQLTVQGKPVKLRKDGTFSLRFALPDGVQEIPIEAVRDDGAEKRKIIPRVERRTR